MALQDGRGGRGDRGSERRGQGTLLDSHLSDSRLPAPNLHAIALWPLWPVGEGGSPRPHVPAGR